MRWWALLLCACGRIGFDEVPSPEETDGFTSGLRLKHQWYELDGVRSWRGIYDSQLDQPCRIANWTDDERYCVPSAGPSLGYLDAACTMPVLVASENPCVEAGPGALYSLEYGLSTSCNGSSFTRLLKADSQIPPVPWYPAYAGGCMGAQPPPTTAMYIAVEAPPTDLVRITAVTEPASGRYAYRTEVSDDGFSIPSGLYDTTLDAPCRPVEDFDDAPGFCKPLSVAGASLFTDAQCMDRLVRVDTPASCPTPAFAAFDDASTCRSELATVGASVSPSPPFYAETNSGSTLQCIQYTPASARPFAVGSLVTPPIATRALDGRGRLQYAYDRLDGTAHRRSRLHDTALDLDCSPMPAADGETRCMPLPNFYLEGLDRYTDAACTQRIDVMAIAAPTPCEPERPRMFGARMASTAACGGGSTRYELTPSSYAGPLYYNPGGLGCQLGAAGLRYDIGPELPPETFVLATPTIDR